MQLRKPNLSGHRTILDLFRGRSDFPGINAGRCGITVSREAFMKTIPGLLFGLLLAGELPAELPVKQVLTLGVAKKIAAAAEAEALKRGSTVVIVVVDDGGHVIVLERPDDAQVGSVEVGIGRPGPPKYSVDQLWSMER
jgi:hypothetical protein